MGLGLILIFFSISTLTYCAIFIFRHLFVCLFVCLLLFVLFSSTSDTLSHIIYLILFLCLFALTSDTFKSHWFVCL